MKHLRRDFERFCYRHQHQGIPNLMLYLAIGTAIMYVFGLIDPSALLYRVMVFDRHAILHGQIWRLFTYVLIPTDTNLLFLAISLFFNYYIGRSIENVWGTFRFNLFYLSGVVITDLAALIFGGYASVGALNLSLLLAFATLYPENQVLLFYIIPIKMKYLAWFYFAVTILDLLSLNLFPIFALLNYFLFFGSDIVNVLPEFMQNWFRQHKRRPSGEYGYGYTEQPRSRSKFQFGSKSSQSQPNPDWAKDYKGKNGERPYRHKCTVCGKTDTDYPDMEFRYCSKCNGYYCYCMDHINNHEHIK